MLKPLSRKELIRKFKVLGYSGPFSGGRHQFMIKGSHKIHIPNPHILCMGLLLFQKNKALKSRNSKIERM